jgi:hypothetical protein
VGVSPIGGAGAALIRLKGSGLPSIHQQDISLLLGAGESTFAQLPERYFAAHRFAVGLAGILHRDAARLAIDLVIDRHIIAFYRARHLRLAQLAFIGAGQCVALLDQNEGRRAAAGARLDCHDPGTREVCRSGHLRNREGGDRQQRSQTRLQFPHAIPP